MVFRSMIIHSLPMEIVYINDVCSLEFPLRGLALFAHVNIIRHLLAGIRVNPM